ncbi:hypothetical protein SDRG_02348 [Saprolegnia diclina VS20]|uniref:PHD-type domain-containing protein n=1 Tax=Saprolegnia diclina (strain VS20) TaxID=1156394 RepID=T0S5V9_SAPDV|nr:hypothetical protein SDRG_02348 [Saprolegnia diclina VS20]EQC40453.1 hypothetical protein SDRG_02348 [Saprolegnia diclina VS20]|eukprot:XP_008606152.1 hypothetical protein SDRG_02348 [Saprolegnia diclina VS20]
MMSVGQLCAQDHESASDMEDKPLALEKKKASQKRRREYSPKPSEEELDTADTNEEDDDDDDDDDLSGRSDNERRGSDHNRWYCNVCKDGGELLCCDRCPRAFHTACLTMDPDDVPSPDSNWYCKLCSDTLERRKAKRDVKEMRRKRREEEKRQRELVRYEKQRAKDEASARRSAKALEDKAKRVLDMRERIVKKQKVTYKDREEEKLGKIAENLAETIRQAKERLDKLEKEDLALRKREQALTKKRGYPIEDLEVVPDDDAPPEPRPTPVPCDFGGLPSSVFHDLLPVWDFVYSFHDLLGLSPISIEQLCSALATSDAMTTLVSEVHMALLDLILENREDASYVPEEEDDMDAMDRYRYEVVHAPLTVGVPTSNMLNFISWPSVLRHLICAVPRYFNNASPDLRAAVDGLAQHEIYALPIAHKVALLRFLVTLAYSTNKVGYLINHNATERVEAAKEHSRMLFHEKRAAAEEDKKLKELQRAEKARVASEQKSAMSSWLKGGKKGAPPTDDDKSVSENASVASASDNDDLDSDESSGTDEEETSLKEMQANGVISRQEYLSRRKKLQAEKDEKRRVRLETRKRQKQKEQLARKRQLVAEELHVAMDIRDVDRLRSSLKAARDLGMHSKRASRNGEPATSADIKLVEDADEFLERLEADLVKEHEMEERKRAFDKTMRQFFVRTEPVGKDRMKHKYWVFRGDGSRVYVENDKHEWAYYDQLSDVKALVTALDARGTREHHLKLELASLLETTLTPVKEESAWTNKARSWSAQLLPNMSVDDLVAQLVHLESWLSKHLEDKASESWTTTTKETWRTTVQACQTAKDLVAPLLAIERQVTDAHMPKLLHDNDEHDVDMEEDEDDDEDETFVDTGLWPSKQARDRWVGTVRSSTTLSSVGLALASFLQRMDVIGLSESSVARKSIRKEKEESKMKEDPDTPTKEARPSKAHEWEEYCCICGDGGELLCCDGCPRVFHYTCVGLRRVPRGKTFCPHCDKSVKPVYPVVRRANLEREVKAESLASPTRDAKTPSTQQWDSYCNDCGAGGTLLLCDGCPKAFHAACLQLDEDDLSPGEDWFCSECENQSCGQCKRGRIRMDSHVICGSEDGTRGCERVFHLKCVKLAAVPADDWYCKKCQKQLK